MMAYSGPRFDLAVEEIRTGATTRGLLS